MRQSLVRIIMMHQLNDHKQHGFSGKKKSTKTRFLISFIGNEKPALMYAILVPLMKKTDHFLVADAAVQLKESELTETILELLKNERTVPEILCNTLTLTRTICSAGKLCLRKEVLSS